MDHWKKSLTVWNCSTRSNWEQYWL